MIDANDASLLKILIPVVLACSASAWGGVKIALNGTRKAIAEGRAEAQVGFNRVNDDIRRLDDKLGDVRDRVSHLEGSRTRGR